MPLAITLRFDPNTALAVARLWDALASTGIDSDRNSLGYTAHVTLAIYPDERQVDRLRFAVSRFGDEWQSLPLGLSGLGVFPGPPAILFAMPVVTAGLLDRQAAIVAALPDVPVHPHYRPGHWVPHVTLSGPLRYPEAALAAILPLWRPVEGTLAGIDLVRFRPVEILASHTFR
jgi:2'-5' RNA ligase